MTFCLIYLPLFQFLELRESSMVQTGPKRPRRGGGGGELWLTPDPLTPLENIQHRQRRRSLTASGKPTPASKPRSITAESSSKRTSSGGRKSAKKATKPKSPEQSSTSDESPASAASTLTPLGHLQLNDQRQDRQSTRVVTSQERESANSEPQEVSSSTSASGSTTSDESPGQTAGYAAVSDITPLEQLYRKKKKRESKRSSVQGTRKSMRKSTMKLRSSGVRGVMWLPHMEHTSSLAPVSLGQSVSASQDHTPPASSTGADGEGHQSDLSPLIQSEEMSSQNEKHPSPSQIGEDEMAAQTEEPEISPKMTKHGASPLTDGLQPSPLTGGHEISPLVTVGAGAPLSSSSSNRYSSGGSAGPEQLKSVLKTDNEGRGSSLKRRTRRNSRVSFGQFVTVAEYNPHHQHSSNRSSRRNSSRNLTMQSFADENSSSMERERASLPDGLQGLGERDKGGRDNGGVEELGGGDSEEEDGDGGVIESAESSSSPPGELEPLGDEGEEEEEMGGRGPGDEGEGELEDESTDEMEVEEPLEEVEQKR